VFNTLNASIAFGDATVRPLRESPTRTRDEIAALKRFCTR
jgi:hypothetical protein